MPQVRPGEGRPNSPIMLVGEVWGKTEEERNAPFAGASGIELNQMLHDAGILRSDCYATNVVNARPPGGRIEAWIPEFKTAITSDMVQLRGRFVKPIVKAGYEVLRREIELVKPRLIFALGNTALWALTGAQGITKWRGSLLNLDGVSSGTRVIPTYNPAMVLRQSEWRTICVRDFRRGARELVDPVPRPPWRFQVRPGFASACNALSALIARMDAGEELWIDFDLETRAGHIACAGVSWSRLDAICIPFMCVEDREGYWSLEEEAQLVRLLRLVLTHPRVKVRGQNLLYDCQYTYKHWHFIPRVAQDTMISHHTLWAGLPKALDFQASMYCDYYVYWKDDGKTWHAKMSEDQLWVYNGMDCVYTRECGEAELGAIEKFGLQEVEKFQQGMFPRVLKLMNRGVRVNLKARRELAMELEVEIQKRHEYFVRLLGHPLNTESPKQMKGLFYGDLRLPIVWKKNDQGRLVETLEDSALELLKQKEPLVRGLIRAIQEKRSLGKFKSTFVEMRLDDDNRMRCSYNIAGQEGYRLSSQKNVWGNGGNLQTIPKGGEEDDSDLVLPNVRKLYIPDEGMTFFDGDLSKADLRVVVWESDCREMKAMLAEGRDPYIETAREFYRDPTISKYNPDGTENIRYDNFKRFSHGTHYLGTPQGLSKRIGLTVHEAERTQKWYFGKYPAIKTWQEQFIEEIKRTRMVRNKFGYQRRYFGRIDDSTFREAVAWLPQSTVAILINKIWAAIEDELPSDLGIEILLQVHDSLDGQFPTERAEECKAGILRVSQITIPYEDPLVIPFALKTSTVSWGDCK